MKDVPKRKSPWINAWSDNVAGIHSLSQLMCTCDMKNDGDYKLIVADLFDNFGQKTQVKGKTLHKSNRVKIYMGTNVIYDTPLEEKPVALTTVYDTVNKPELPMIAVAGGPKVLMRDA